MSNKLSAIKDIEAAIDSLNKKLGESDKQIIKISTSARGAASAFSNITAPKQLNQGIKQTTTVTEQLNAQLKEQDRLERALITQIERKRLASEATARALAKERFETKEVNRLVREAATLSSRYASEIQKAAIRRNQAARSVQDFTVKQKLGIKLTKEEIKELQKAEREFKKYDNAVRSAREKTGRFQDSVGNYEKGFKGLLNVGKQLIGIFGIVEGIRLFGDFASQAAELAREAKGVEFAFERLGYQGVKAFEEVKASTRGLLSDLDIKRSLVEFDNFNIGLEESATLFEFLAVRATQTGTSIDKLKDSLVEGLSKESKLRIDNLGISASQLNEELERTPNFVQAVANIAKTEIAEAGDILDEAANSQERLNAAWENFKVSAGQGFIGSLTSEWQDFKAAIANTLTTVNDASDGFFDFVQNLGRVSTGYGAVVAAEAALKNAAKERVEVVERILKLQKEQGVSEERLIRNREQLLKLDREQLDNIEEELAKRKEVNEETERTVGYLNELIQKETEKIQGASTREEVKAIQDRVKALEAERDALLGVVDTTTVAMEGTIAFYEELIKQLSKEQKELADSTEKYKDYEEKILAAKAAIEALKGALEKPVNADDLLDARGAEIANDLAFGFFSWRMEKEEERNAEANAKKLEQDKEYAEQKAELMQDLYRGMTELVNTLFDRRIQAIDDEIQKNRDKYAAILDDESLTEQERSQREAERDRKERELEKRKREEQRKQAIFNKALNVAEIGINTAAAISEASPNPFLIALAAAVGAAQLATALATPIPKYEKGKNLKDNYQGEAIWGEKRREVRIGRRGIELSPKYAGNHKTYVYSDDIIHPDADAFFAEYNAVLQRNNIGAAMSKQEEAANSIINVKTGGKTGNDTRALIAAIERNKARLTVHNSIDISGDLRYLQKLNEI